MILLLTIFVIHNIWILFIRDFLRATLSLNTKLIYLLLRVFLFSRFCVSIGGSVLSLHIDVLFKHPWLHLKATILCFHVWSFLHSYLVAYLLGHRQLYQGIAYVLFYPQESETTTWIFMERFYIQQLATQNFHCVLLRRDIDIGRFILDVIGSCTFDTFVDNLSFLFIISRIPLDDKLKF